MTAFVHEVCGSCLAGENYNNGGTGGFGRIKLEGEVVELTSVVQPIPVPGSRPPLVPLEGGPLSVAAGDMLTLNTDAYSVYRYDSLTIEFEGTITAVGSRPLVLEVSGNCEISGLIDVSGGNGEHGRDGGNGAGGGVLLRVGPFFRQSVFTALTSSDFLHLYVFVRRWWRCCSAYLRDYDHCAERSNLV